MTFVHCANLTEIPDNPAACCLSQGKYLCSLTGKACVAREEGEVNMQPSHYSPETTYSYSHAKASEFCPAFTEMEDASLEPILVELPKHMTAVYAAECFNTYLIGGLSFENTKAGDGARRHGPVELEGKWQLDHSNDYWLREIKAGTLRLTCRYPGQYDLLKAMVALFQARYPAG